MSSTITNRKQLPSKPSRPSGFEEKYRLYLDESGDHVFRNLHEAQYRFLYHFGLGFLLQRYAGYLNHINRMGDGMAEACGGKEDRLLKESYTRVHEHGVWMKGGQAFQAALSSRELKLKLKSANIAGLQLADILGHPVKQWVLKKHDLLDEKLSPFSDRLINVVLGKFNRHLYEGRMEGYGYVLYPQKIRESRRGSLPIAPTGDPPPLERIN